MSYENVKVVIPYKVEELIALALKIIEKHVADNNNNLLGNAAPTNDGLIAKANLIARGCTVLTN